MAPLLGLDSPLKQGIFASYVLLWVASHLLVYSSKLSGAPPYNATSVVLATEALKLTLAMSLYLYHDGGLAKLARDAASSPQLLLRYQIPALLYCVYNNLVYVNLASFDPATYNVLMQLRIVLTGVVYQFAFSKRLNRNQWLSVVLITAGCVAKESSKLFHGELRAGTGAAWLLLLVQMCCSIVAGVYNEVLLKGGGDAALVSTNLQNAYMYASSVAWNAVFLLLRGTLHEALAPENLRTIFSPTLLSVMMIMSSVGMVTGFFLKHLDSVLKAIAAACEVVFTTIASRVLFGTPLDAQACVATALVGWGVALYARPPRRDEYELIPAEG